MNQQEDAAALLRQMLKGVATVSETAVEDRIDVIAGFKVPWENGIDIRVSIKLLRKMQKLLAELDSEEEKGAMST